MGNFRQKSLFSDAKNGTYGARIKILGPLFSSKIPPIWRDGKWLLFHEFIIFSARFAIFQCLWFSGFSLAHKGGERVTHEEKKPTLELNFLKF